MSPTTPTILASVFKNRSRDHAINAYLMLYEPEKLVARAGQGVRQGFGDAGPRSDRAVFLRGQQRHLGVVPHPLFGSYRTAKDPAQGLRTISDTKATATTAVPT